MSDLDKTIQDTLSKEDAEFLAQFDKEPSSVRQIAGVFDGPFRWLSALFFVVALIAGLGILFAGWKFFQVDELSSMVRLGFIVVVGLIVLATVRIWFFMQIQTNRVLRELKRVELEVARLSRQS